MYIFLLVLGGGQDKLAWTACPPGVKITRVGGKLSRGQDKLGHRYGSELFCYSIFAYSLLILAFHFEILILLAKSQLLALSFGRQIDFELTSWHLLLGTTHFV